jgi:citrate lyase subunit beta / citryl-CoA lyase
VTKINPFKIASLLFIPALNTKFVNKALTFTGINKPDGIIFDLEDSIHPDSKKQARENLLTIFHTKKLITQLQAKYIICVRVNHPSTPWFAADLRLVNQIKPNFLMLPKADSAKTVVAVRRKSLVKQMIVAIETMTGLKNISEITAAMNFYDFLATAYEDPASELLIERPPDLNSVNPLTSFMMICILAARTNNLLVIDGPARLFNGQKAIKQLEKECVFSLRNGLNCKIAIHPNQVSVINKIFNKKLVLAKVKNVLGQFKSLANGSFVIVNDRHEMMDTPSYKMYTKLLAYWNK